MSAAFRCQLSDYNATSADDKLGKLIAAAGQSGFATQHLSQIPAWQTQLSVLGECITALLSIRPEARRWELLLEYPIPRRDKRPDAVLLADDVIVVLEFKIGANSFDSVDKWQVLSYALDLRDFHAESAARSIVTMLVATGDAVEPETSGSTPAERGTVLPVQAIAAKDGDRLARRILLTYGSLHDSNAVTINVNAWDQSAYRPSLNIIEAAESLFAGHSVTGISHKFAINL